MAWQLVRIEHKFGKYWVVQYVKKGPFDSVKWFSGPHQHRADAEKVYKGKFGRNYANTGT